MKIFGIVLIVLAIAVVLLFASRSYMSRQNPQVLGLVDGKLRSCPSSPNCVVSEGGDSSHTIEPLAYRDDRAASERALEAALAKLGNTTIVKREGDYWQAQSVSRLFRFIDDVEVSFDDVRGQIHLRSASRVGHSDLGANRKRMAAVRAAYQAA